VRSIVKAVKNSKKHLEVVDKKHSTKIKQVVKLSKEKISKKKDKKISKIKKSEHVDKTKIDKEIKNVKQTIHIEPTPLLESKIEESPAPKIEIKSLEDMKEKILEKLEENPLIIHNPEVHVLKEDKSNPLEDNKARVEAILFAVGKYLEEESISQLCEIDKRNTKKALEELKKDYDSKKSALIIIQEGNNWKINVREKYLSLVRKIVSDTELSKSIMETLSVIAWKSPIYQNEVVRIRGNKCYDHIAELETAGFITKIKKGRSYVIKTTDKFYNYFDIDQKNLQSVMSEAKIPTVQTTLEETKPTEEIIDSREKLLKTLETIETRRIEYREEDKISEKAFLEQMHNKIEATSKRTDEYSADIPRPMHEQEPPQVPLEAVTEQPPEIIEGGAVKIKDDEDIVITTDSADGEHHFQKPEDQHLKPKQLTKKQLEKKFKDELQRVKEKMQK
jgi:segregation and condensation protein B